LYFFFFINTFLSIFINFKCNVKNYNIIVIDIRHKLNLIKANQKAKQQMNLEILKEREELFKDSKGQNVKNKKR